MGRQFAHLESTVLQGHTSRPCLDVRYVDAPVFAYFLTDTEQTDITPDKLANPSHRRVRPAITRILPTVTVAGYAQLVTLVAMMQPLSH